MIFVIRVELFDDLIERVCEVDPLTGKISNAYKRYQIYPAYAYSSTKERISSNIKKELNEIKIFRKENKLIEEQRLEQRTNHDIESLIELGMCPGIENY